MNVKCWLSRKPVDGPTAPVDVGTEERIFFRLLPGTTMVTLPHIFVQGGVPVKRNNARNIEIVLWSLSVFLCPSVLGANEVTIIVKSDANAIVRFAGQELRKHLGLILGQEPPIETASAPGGLEFYVGVRPPNDAESFQQLEEAGYTIDNGAVYLYGDDEVVFKYEVLEDNVTKPGAIAHNRMGTLFAVYFFLEEELGVRWVEPGDAGISYERQQRLEFTPRRRIWRTHCPYERRIRSYVWDGADRKSVV